jgi:hypothetical protein
MWTGPRAAVKGKRRGGGSEPGTSRPEAHHGAVGIGRLPVRMGRECLKASAVRAPKGRAGKGPPMGGTVPSRMSSWVVRDQSAPKVTR